MCGAWRIGTVLAGMLLLLTGCAGGEPGESADVPVSLTSETQTEQNPVRETLTPDNVRVMGRITMDKTVFRLEWTNSGVELRFTGTGIQAMLGTSETNTEQYPAVAVQVDGGEYKRISVKKTGLITLAEGLPSGEHTLRLVKITEATAHPVFLSYVEIFPCADGRASLDEPLPAPGRRIEFIGDSITCGYGNLGDAGTKVFLTSQQDGLQTYASLTADALQADARYICMSGRGIVQNVNSSMEDLLPQLFSYASPTKKEAWDFTAWQPDVVVINAGTNDVSGGASAQLFIEGAVDFMEHIRSVYPQAKILWCYGMMNREFHDAVEEAVRRFNDSDGGAAYLALRDVMLGESGAVGHPNVKGHAARAALVTQAVQQLTGWTVSKAAG